MIGTRLISGSDATSLRNFSMAASESSMPSSMLMSMTWAPFSTCSRATSSASSNSSSLIRREKRAEPVTLVRSPTFTNRESCLIVERFQAAKAAVPGSISGILRGGISLMASCNRRDVIRCRTTATAEDVNKAFLGELGNDLGHFLGRLVIVTKLIGQTGVRVS